MEEIKLVIWDLDETFWKGTLSEGAVEPIEENVALVRRLTDRGIVNSICSKNDFGRAREELEALGVWDLFVFPSIDWSGKGERVGQIIREMNLRPANVLFVDDNVSNLQEALYSVPDLQTTAPDALGELARGAAFAGKDDRGHSRLAQYKILEKKAEARSSSGSNEEFLYQSDIRVEMIEDCGRELERIHEMIHRNNQLNYTKDRISPDEVRELFLHPEARSGYVKVADKYGDHGICGCYALLGGVLRQFVFSCRILGMGVEQWVYAQLGYPEIHVSGEVARELSRTELPGWINRAGAVPGESGDSSGRKCADTGAVPGESGDSSGGKCAGAGDAPGESGTGPVGKRSGTGTPKENGSAGEGRQAKLIVYGFCPLRPIWGYLEPKLSDARFSEFGNAPVVLNLAVTEREREDVKAEWLSKVRLFDSAYTFDGEIFEKERKYILVSLDGQKDVYKYTSPAGTSWFYSQKLSKDTADVSILRDYRETKVTFEDIEREMAYLLAHLPDGTKLMVLTIPDLVFPGRGKDDDYQYRIGVNEILDRLDARYENLALVDIRREARTPNDFFDAFSYHYNRAIGYKMARKILEIMRYREPAEEKNTVRSNAEDAPANRVRRQFALPDASAGTLEYWIRNGQLAVAVHPRKGEFEEITLEIWRDRIALENVKYQAGQVWRTNVYTAGNWRVAARIRAKGQKEEARIVGDVIPYTEFNYMQYFDPGYENYVESSSAINQFCSDNRAAADKTWVIYRDLSMLAASGCNPADFFLEKGIGEITLITERRIGEALIPFLHQSALKIRRIYTTDFWWKKRVYGNPCTYELLQWKEDVVYDEDEIVLFADYRSENLSILRHLWNKHVRLYYLIGVLRSLATREFFVKKLQGIRYPKMIVARCVKICAWGSVPLEYLRPDERNLLTKLKDDREAYAKLDDPSYQFPEQFAGRDREELRETLRRPAAAERGGRKYFQDVRGKYLNIRNGFRVTAGQPENGIGRIYIVGDSFAFGCGVRDEETVASCLQRLIGLPYRVENYANCWEAREYDDVLDLLRGISFRENDVVCFLQSQWRTGNVFEESWMKWEAMEAPVLTVDTFPLLKNTSRPDYYLLPNSFTPAGNEAVARLLRDKIYEHISLF